MRKIIINALFIFLVGGCVSNKNIEIMPTQREYIYSDYYVGMTIEEVKERHPNLKLEIKYSVLDINLATVVGTPLTGAVQYIRPRQMPYNNLFSDDVTLYVDYPASMRGFYFVEDKLYSIVFVILTENNINLSTFNNRYSSNYKTFTYIDYHFVVDYEDKIVVFTPPGGKIYYISYFNKNWLEQLISRAAP